MKNLDVLGMCVRNLVKRKLRTFLTMLGVIIGTAALVLTVSLGLANEARFDRMIDEWDRDLSVITVHESGGMTQNPDTGEWEAGGLNPDLDDTAIAILRNLPGVRMASPSMWGPSLHIRSGGYSADVWNVQAIDPSSLAYMDRELAYGRLLEPDDPFGSVVVGAFFELNFDIMGIDWQMRSDRFGRVAWGGESLEDMPQYVDIMNDPLTFSYDMNYTWRQLIGEDLEDAFRPIRAFPLNIVGVFAPSGIMWDATDQSIFMDVETAQALTAMAIESRRDDGQQSGWYSAIRETPRENYDRVEVRVYDVRDAGEVADMIRALGFTAWFEADDILRRQEMQQGTLGLLIGIAAVSIFVAAISIANTMIMAVYERTREIGVMKVIGGSIPDIRKMFLLEAALIGFFGGILGVLVSLLGSYMMNNTTIEALVNMGFGATADGDITSLVTLWLMGVALVFASVIGLVSGYFPARRATKLSALEAIRTD
ncbi:MAG: ABC transporter permease [Defluviitaleaceae bacterium]|nr:ABC transporter permease [Defluviitaleaceae bacterium]